MSRGATGDRLLTREFLTVGAASGLYFLAFGALNALTPLFVVDELGGTEATSGFVMGSLAISALLSRPHFGRISDRHGARRIVLIGGLLGVLSMVIVVAVPTLVGVVASRLVLGGGSAAVVTGATTLSLDIAPAHRRGQAASYMLIAFHVGLGLGPVGGEALLDRFSFSTVFACIGVCAAACALVARTLPVRPTAPAAEPTPLVHRGALLPGVVSLLGVFAFNGFLQFAPLYGREIGLEDVGLVFTVASGTIIIVRIAFGSLPDRVGPIPAASGALVVTMIAATTVALWSAPVGMFIGAALLAMGLSLQSPSLITLAADGVPDRERGAAMATFTGFFDIANATIGPMVGLIVIGAGYRAAFLATGVFALVGLLVLQLGLRPRAAQV